MAARESPDPAHNLSIGACVFVPEIGEILKELVVGNDERGNERCGNRPAFAVAPGQAGVPAVRRPLNKESPAKNFDFAQDVASCRETVDRQLPRITAARVWF